MDLVGGYDYAQGMSGVAKDEPFTLHCADARTLATLIPGVLGLPTDGHAQPLIQATVTSPPYGRLVDYGVPDQIGHGQDENQYLADCRAVFKTIFDWTKHEGVLWLVADSYLDASVGPGKPSRFQPLPFTLAALAEAEGWTLREVIVWHKDRTRPWSHHGKLRNAFEYVLLLVKSKDFYFNVDRLRDSRDLARWWVQYPERYHARGKAPDNVWDVPIPVQGSWAGKAYQHACPLPVELVRRMLELTTTEGDLVFDPFAGIGTVVATANGLGRRGFGTELNPAFVNHYAQHVREEVAATLAEAAETSASAPTPERIALLRALKYPKTLFAAYRRDHPELPLPDRLIVDISELRLAEDGNTLNGVDWFFVFDEGNKDSERVQVLLKELAAKAPLSKFSVNGDIRVVDGSEAVRTLEKRPTWFAYEHGRTWVSSLAMTNVGEAMALPVSVRRGSFIPVIGSHDISINLDTVGDPAADDPTR